MRLIFAGTPEVAAVALRELAAHHEIALVITRPDAPVGRKKVMTPSPVADLAAEMGIETLKTSRIGQAEIERIRSKEAELGFVVAYGALLPKAALELFDWWNLHFSLLPKWRGATPLQHSIMHSDGQGLTIFKLDEGMDTGDIVGTIPKTFDSEQTAAELLPILAKEGAEHALELLEAQPAAIPQQGDPSYAPKLSRGDARLDFTESADAVARKVMAMNPEPVAWTESAGEPIRILRAKSVGSIDWSSLEEKESVVGSVELSGEKVLVTCGKGTRLQLQLLQPAGKRAMNALDWFRGLQERVTFG
ncbi:MAG: methionyl-tRNA formyltransferase [Aquiluna sp.]